MSGSDSSLCWYPGGVFTVVRHPLQLTLFLLQFLLYSWAEHPDNCDWTIWDGTEQPRGVRNIFGRCSEGHIDWRHPFGALRVSLQLGTRSETNFETCFTAKSHYIHAKISLEDSSFPAQTSEPSLTPLVTLNRTHPQMPREMCFKSKGRPVVLYLEVLYDRQATNIGHIELDYDNQRIFPRVTQDDMEDCRPCTDSEVLYAACSSDFVIRGSMDAVFHSVDAEESVVRLSVEKIHRQKGSLFRESTALTENEVRASVLEPRRTEGDNEPFSVSRSDRTDGQVVVPSKCKIHRGEGSFLFIGRIRLKRALLKCAPRLEDFEVMWRQAVRTGNNMCLLD